MRSKERSQIERGYSWTEKIKQNRAVTPDASFIKVKAPDIEKSADKNTQIDQTIGSKKQITQHMQMVGKCDQKGTWVYGETV